MLLLQLLTQLPTGQGGDPGPVPHARAAADGHAAVVDAPDSRGGEQHDLRGAHGRVHAAAAGAAEVRRAPKNMCVEGCMLPFMQRLSLAITQPRMLHYDVCWLGCALSCRLAAGGAPPPPGWPHIVMKHARWCNRQWCNRRPAAPSLTSTSPSLAKPPISTNRTVLYNTYDMPVL